MKYIVAIIFFCSLTCHASPFPDLTKKELKFGWSEAAATNEITKYYISYNKKFFTEINTVLGELDKTNPLYTDEFGASDILVGKVDLSGKGDFYYIVLSFGSSYDVAYAFYSVKKANEFRVDSGETFVSDFEIPALSIIIPSNGNLYSYGHNNNLYNLKSKYLFREGAISELPQEFFYVGEKTVSLKEQIIYTDMSLSKELYRVSAGTPVIIVGIKTKDAKSNEKLYMVASEFGLVGYVQEEKDYKNTQAELQFKGFYFNGD